MFDLNILGKPGLQPKKVNSSISFLQEVSQPVHHIPLSGKIQNKQKSRVSFLVIIGFLIAGISAIGFLYFLPKLNLKNHPKLPIYNTDISQNEIVSGLIDLLLNEEFSSHISMIEFKRNEIRVQFLLDDENLINKLMINDFYGINIRTKLNEFGDKTYLYKIPWKAVSNPLDKGLEQIKDQISERFVLSNTYDFKTGTDVLIINEFKNIVSVLLRLHDANILQNFGIKIEPKPNEFTTILLKNF